MLPEGPSDHGLPMNTHLKSQVSNLRSGIAALSACAFLCSASTVVAQSCTYTRIADTSTTIPGTAFTFNAFAAPAIDNGTVGFAGYGNSSGVYRGSGGSLEVVADTTTSIPQGSGTFTTFSPERYWPSVGPAHTAFTGDGSGISFIQRGLYLRSPTGLTRIVDRNTPMPNATGNFYWIYPPNLESERLVFSAEQLGDGQRGIYNWQSGSL